MVTADDLEPEVDAVDPVLARAMETIERADMTLAEPRPGRDGAAEYERILAERAEPIVKKRAQPEAIIRKTRTQPAAAAAPPDDLVRVDELVTILREVIDRERKDADARIAAALAEANVRISRTEARLAAIEGRVAGVESRKGKK